MNVVSRRCERSKKEKKGVGSNLPAYIRKIAELSEEEFVVETVTVPIHTHYEPAVKLSMENYVSGPSQSVATSLDLGDQVIAINGKKTANRDESRDLFRDIKKEFLTVTGGKKAVFEVQVTRRRLRRLRLSLVPKLLASEDLPKGFEYYQAVLVMYPNSVIGFNVKPAINQRCMVSSVDGGWQSLAKKVFLVGDIILYISGSKGEGQEVCSVTAAKVALKKYARELVLRVWFARAKDPICIKQVRAALIQDRSTTAADPRMAADCAEIVKAELGAMDYRFPINVEICSNRSRSSCESAPFMSGAFAGEEEADHADGASCCRATAGVRDADEQSSAGSGCAQEKWIKQ